jgi:hypothetical protein
MSKICETCLKLVKIIYCSKYVSQSFTSVVDVFMKLVKYFLLFKFVSICFSFVKKGTIFFTNLKAQYVVDSYTTQHMRPPVVDHIRHRTSASTCSFQYEITLQAATCSLRYWVVRRVVPDWVV